MFFLYNEHRQGLLNTFLIEKRKEPGCVVAATLTLSAAPDIADVDSFNFNITIQGTA